MDEDDELVIKITRVPWSRMILKKKSVKIPSKVNSKVFSSVQKYRLNYKIKISKAE